MFYGMVFPQSMPCPQSFIAEVAGDDNSLEMFRFNVIFYLMIPPFLSTYLAQIGETTVIV